MRAIRLGATVAASASVLAAGGDVTCVGLPIPAPGAKPTGGRSLQDRWTDLAAGLRF